MVTDPNSPSAASSPRAPILELIEGLEARALASGAPLDLVRELLRGMSSLADASYGAYWRMEGEKPRQIASIASKVSERAAAAWVPGLAELAEASAQSGAVCHRQMGEAAEGLITGRRYVALGFAGGQANGGPKECVTLVVAEGSAILCDAGIGTMRLFLEFPLLHDSMSRAGHFENTYQALSGAWTLLSEMLAFNLPTEIAQVAANRGRQLFHAERCAIGFVDRGKVKLAAVSGQDIVDHRSNILHQLQSAQMEVVISGEAAIYSSAAATEERLEQANRHPHHAELCRVSGAAVAISLPLRREKELIGVWTYEFSDAAAIQKNRAAMEVLAGQAGPVLHLARQNDRGPIRRARDNATEMFRKLLSKEHPWRMAGCIAGALLLLFALFGRWTFTVAGDATLEPSMRRIYAAPFDATVRVAPVRPGDEVKAGQTLVELDRDQVEMMLREARSQWSAAEKERLTYLTETRLAQAAVAEARRDALAADISLLEHQLKQTNVTAQESGIVLAGDLTRSIGQPVRMGEAMIEVAPLDSMLLLVELDQDDVAHVAADQTGRFTTKMRLGTRVPFRVIKVRPSPEVRNGRSVYLAEAVVQNDGGLLRPGEASARIEIGRRNVTWVATRKLLNWLRMKLWW